MFKSLIKNNLFVNALNSDQKLMQQCRLTFRKYHPNSLTLI